MIALLLYLPLCKHLLAEVLFKYLYYCCYSYFYEPFPGCSRFHAVPSVTSRWQHGLDPESPKVVSGHGGGWEPRLGSLGGKVSVLIEPSLLPPH